MQFLIGGQTGSARLPRMSIVIEIGRFCPSVRGECCWFLSSQCYTSVRGTRQLGLGAIGNALISGTSQSAPRSLGVA